MSSAIDERSIAWPCSSATMRSSASCTGRGGGASRACGKRRRIRARVSLSRRSGKRTATMPRSPHTMAQRPIGVAKSAKPCSAMALFSPEKEVADRVPEASTARLELGGGSLDKTGRRRFQKRFVHKDRIHVLGIVRPVGGRVEGAAGRELARRKRRELRLHQATLVVPLLRPGIGKEQRSEERR